MFRALVLAIVCACAAMAGGCATCQGCYDDHAGCGPGCGAAASQAGNATGGYELQPVPAENGSY